MSNTGERIYTEDASGRSFTYTEWMRHYDKSHAQGRCPFSGETIRRCKATDLCDCYDFPEGTQ